MTEESLFELLLQTPENERAALLDRECAGQPEMRERIASLLAAHDQPASWLQPRNVPTTPERAAGHEKQGGSAGTIIASKYKLLQKVGEGGMGTVWMADQTAPVKRRVAVKLIRVDCGASKPILSRFEAERQAIALMDHPHIARLLDAGTTDAGQPYFVMELVKGIPLTEFCDAHRLSIPERLQLFMQICSAVQHAHQKGIIHRDLKPSNILVEDHDGKPIPKVIDFGLAKATSGLQLSEHTLFTAFGNVVGTPLYMAPEQATFNAVDVDTRADIYALGVILYELLTGTTPIARETVKKAALDELMKLIREQEAPTPSSRLRKSATTASVAANRQVEPARLGRFVKGDLDWIVMKALAKERDRRYETANGFAKDVERFLNQEPVQAGPPSTSYRLRKFMLRNRGQVIAASVVLFALLVGIAGTTLGLIRAQMERARAMQAEEEAHSQASAAEDARDQAEANARKARAAVHEYFTLVSENRLLDVPGLNTLRKELLESALRYYQANVDANPHDPNALADLAVTYLRLMEINYTVDRNDECIACLDKAQSLLDRLVREHPDAQDSHLRVAGFHKGLRRDHLVARLPGDPQAAHRSLAKLSDTLETLAGKYPEIAGFRSDVAGIHRLTGELLLYCGKTEEGAKLLGKSTSEWEQLVRDHPDSDNYRSELGLTRLVASQQTQLSQLEAEQLLREGFADLKLLVDKHPRDPRHRISFAYAHLRLGQQLPKEQVADKEKHFRTALGLTTALDREFPGTRLIQQFAVMAGHELLLLIDKSGDPDEVAALYRSTIRLSELAVANTHASRQNKRILAIRYRSFAEFLVRQGAGPQEILWYHQQALELFRELVGNSTGREGRAEVLYCHAHIGNQFTRLGKMTEAEQHYRQALDIAQALDQEFRGKNSYLDAIAHIAYALLRNANETAEPKQQDAHYRNTMKVYEMCRAAAPKNRWFRERAAFVYRSYGNFLERTRLRVAEVEPNYQKSLELFEQLTKDFPTEPFFQEYLGHGLRTLGNWHWFSRQFVEAEGDFKRALEVFEAMPKPTDEKQSLDRELQIGDTRCLLGGALVFQRKHVEAEEPLLRGYRELRRLEQRVPDWMKPRLPQTADRLIAVYKALGKPDEVTRWQEERAKYAALDTIPKDKQ